MISLSVVIPTYNRGRKFLNTLESLKLQNFSKSFEVIIVNDGSIDDTKSILDSLDITNYPFKLRIKHQANMGRAGSRNIAFKMAESDLIVSFDDDMRLEPDCLSEHYWHHQNYPASILVGGLREDPKLAKTDIQKYLAHVRLGWQKVLENTSKPMKASEIYITAANFSISKTTFNQIGGFDENLRAVVDYDLAMRAHLLKIPIYYNQNAFAWHDDFITCRSYILRRRQSTENEKYLLETKPELIRQFHRYKDSPPSIFKKLIYSIAGRNFFVNTIDKDIYCRFLPKVTRYKFYDIVITALSKYYPQRRIS